MMILTRENCSKYGRYKDVSILDLKLKAFNLNTSKIFFVDDVPNNVKNLKSPYVIPIKPYQTRRNIYRDRTFVGDRDDYLLKIMKMSYNL